MTTLATTSEARFREARADDWARLETLLAKVERGSLRRIPDEELFALPVLYRAALSSLSVARETSLDRDLVAYLEGLATRAYFVTYGVRTPLWRRIVHFFAADWPAAVRDLGRELLVAWLVMAAGAVAAWLLVAHDPSWFYAIVGPDLATGRDPSASTEQLRHTLYAAQQKDLLGFFATFLFTHNTQVSFFSFALGAAFGVPTVLLLAYNGCMLGAFMALYAAHGLGVGMAGWLFIHGTTELFAIAIAGAGGLRIGLAVVFPGRLSRLAAAAAAGRVAGVAMIGVVLMLAVAGVLEGVGRQTVLDDPGRFAIGGVALAGWLLYFFAPWRRARA